MLHRLAATRWSAACWRCTTCTPCRVGDAAASTRWTTARRRLGSHGDRDRRSARSTATARCALRIPGRLRRRHGQGRRRGGGGELGAGGHRGRCSTAAAAGPPLLQIGVRRPAEGRPVTAVSRCGASCASPRPAGAAAGAVRAVRHAGAAASIRTSSQPAERRTALRVRRRAGSCSTTPARRRQIPHGARPLPRRPRLHLTDAQWDALPIPVGIAFFLRNSTAGPGHRLLPQPGGGHRERAALDGVAHGHRRRPRSPD